MEGIPERNILPEGYRYHREGYLWHVLPVGAFAELPPTVVLDGEEFSAKDEFHVTVANVRAMAQEVSGSETDVEAREQEIQGFLTEYLQGGDISFAGFGEDLRLAVTAERKSIAARCEMLGIEGYFDLLESTYGKKFPLQPAHVSIYTVNGMAVGISSDEQMESYRKVDLPDVQSVLNAIEI